MSPPPRPSPRRVDAERNRQRIISAAREAFADTHADVSMAEISRRSGVGSATLYRNFANRRELLEALYLDEVDALCVAAEAIQAATPGATLTAWLRDFYDYFSSKRLVADELLQHAKRDDPVFGDGYSRVIAAGQPLLDAARASGEIASDLSLEQVLDLIASIAKIPGDDSYREPIREAAINALLV